MTRADLRVLTLVVIGGALLALVRCYTATPPGHPAVPSPVPDVYMDSARGVVCYSFQATGYVTGRSVSCVKQ